MIDRAAIHRIAGRAVQGILAAGAWLSRCACRIPGVEALLEGSRARFQRLGIRAKLALTFAELLLMTVGIFGVTWFFQERSLLYGQFGTRAQVLVEQSCDVGRQAILLGAETNLQPLYGTIQNGSALYILVFNAHRKLLAPITQAGLTEELQAPPAFDREERIERRLNGIPVLEHTKPIVSKRGDQEIVIGAVRVGISLEEIRKASLRLWLKVIFLALLVLGVGVASAWSLSNMITSPVLEIVKAMKRVAAGDLNQSVPHVSPDEIGTLAEAFNSMVTQLREKALMEFYLSRGALQRVKQMRMEEKIRLGGERRPIAIFFSDLRNSTSLAEQLPAEEVVRIFNVYLHLQTQVIHRAGGVVDKFLGDGIMAFFEGPDMEHRATKAAFQIQKQFAILNQFRRHLGLPFRELGIGIHQGEAVLGNMGSEELMSYTAIGDNVNVTQRLCATAEPGQTILSETVQRAVGSQLKCTPLPPLQLKGRTQPVQAYILDDLVAVDDFERRQYARRQVALPLAFVLDDDPEKLREATLIDLGPGGLQMDTGGTLQTGTRLKVKIPGQKPFVLGPLELQGEVVWIQADPPRIGVAFEEMSTLLPEKIALWAYTPETNEVEEEPVSREAPPPDRAAQQGGSLPGQRTEAVPQSP